MLRRRTFLQRSLGAIALAPIGRTLLAAPKEPSPPGQFPMVVSTWNFGMEANDAAWKQLSAGKRALDAVEAGVKVPEADPKNQSVGYGGLPDRDGRVTLDACIMDEHGDCGSVGALESIMHPISVARLVMETTPHVMLVGGGALQFALENGFHKENLLTEASKKDWEKWVKGHHYTPHQVNHDTIGMLAIDQEGNLSGACTTSGLAYKVHGRVGDSPIIGAGLYVDNAVGGATSTGIGEEVIKVCGSFLVVELMRNGATPEEACRTAVERIIRRHGGVIPEDFQVGFLALNKKGEYGGFSVVKGFQIAVRTPAERSLIDARFAGAPKE